MPSPGSPSIVNSIATSSGFYAYEGAATLTYFSSGAPFIQKLATAMNAGWATLALPVTPTTMETAFNSEFSDFFTSEATVGKNFVLALAKGIDQDIAAWATSYVYPPGSGTHTYTVTATTIKNRIIALSPLVSNGSTALINAVADVFINNFGQETG